MPLASLSERSEFEALSLDFITRSSSKAEEMYGGDRSTPLACVF